jgi:hypothetical protein
MRAGQLCPGFEKRPYNLVGEEYKEGWKYRKDEFQIPDNYLNCLGQGICKNGMVSERRQAKQVWVSTLKECDSDPSLSEYDLQAGAASVIDTDGFSVNEEGSGTIEQDKPTPVLMYIDVNNILWLLLGFLTGCLLVYGYLSKVPSTHSTSLKVRRPEL